MFPFCLLQCFHAVVVVALLFNDLFFVLLFWLASALSSLLLYFCRRALPMFIYFLCCFSRFVCCFVLVFRFLVNTSSLYSDFVDVLWRTPSWLMLCHVRRLFSLPVDNGIISCSISWDLAFCWKCCILWYRWTSSASWSCADSYQIQNKFLIFLYTVL